MQHINLTDLPALISGILEAQEEIKAQLTALAARLDAHDTKIADGAAQLSACHGELARRVGDAHAYITRLDRDGMKTANDHGKRVAQLEKAVEKMPDLSGPLVELSSCVGAVEAKIERMGRVLLSGFDVPTPFVKGAPNQSQPTEKLVLGVDRLGPFSS